MTTHTPIVQTLKNYMTENPEFGTAFKQSFDLAYATGLPEFKLYNIYDVESYLRYMDEYVHWVPSEDKTGRNVYYHICMFYFIIDLPPVRDHQSPIDPSSKSPWRWMSKWLIEYALEMGLWMNTPESITPESLQSFYTAPSYRMQDYPVPPGGWKTFNEFFARHIDPALRPIAPGENVLVSPADCAFDGQWAVNAPEATVTTFDVKGVPWDISQLLYDEVSGTDYGPLFQGGTFTHSFLAPNDYHRQHAPLAGRVVDAKVIPGICYLEVVLDTTDQGTEKSPRLGMHRHMHRPTIPLQEHVRRHAHKAADSDAPKTDVDAPDSPGYQFLQARGLVLIDNPVAGLVAVLPIGMAQVSSVVLSVQKGDVVQKGQEISYFQLGGSDIVMVFQKDANVKFDQVKGEHYNFGTAVGMVGNA